MEGSEIILFLFNALLETSKLHILEQSQKNIIDHNIYLICINLGAVKSSS